MRSGRTRIDESGAEAEPAKSRYPWGSGDVYRPVEQRRIEARQYPPRANSRQDRSVVGVSRTTCAVTLCTRVQSREAAVRCRMRFERAVIAVAAAAAAATAIATAAAS